MTIAPRRLVEAGLALMLVCAPVTISGTQAGLALALVGALWELRGGHGLPRTPLDAPILALLGVTLLSALLSDAPADALRRFSGAWVTLAFTLTVGWLGDPARLERFLLLLLPSGALLAVYGVVQHFTGLDLTGRGLPALEIGGRGVFFPRGGFSHYQTYANVFFLLFCLGFALSVAGAGRARLWRGAATSLVGAAVVLTYTRGIWISLLAALGVFTVFFASRAALLLAAAAAAALAALLLVPSSLQTRALSMADRGANIERLLLWETTWNMVRDAPVLGVGIGNYRRAQEAYVRDEIPLKMTGTHAHNIWLQAAVERGALGLLALLWLSAALAAESLRAVRALGPAGGLPRALAAGALAALAGFYIDGLVQNNFGDSQVALLFWLIAGVVVVCGRQAPAALPAGAPV